MKTKDLIAQLQKLDENNIVSINIILPDGESGGDIVDFTIHENTHEDVSFTTLYVDMEE